MFPTDGVSQVPKNENYKAFVHSLSLWKLTVNQNFLVKKTFPVSLFPCLCSGKICPSLEIFLFSIQKTDVMFQGGRENTIFHRQLQLLKKNQNLHQPYQLTHQPVSSKLFCWLSAFWKPFTQKFDNDNKTSRQMKNTLYTDKQWQLSVTPLSIYLVRTAVKQTFTGDRSLLCASGNQFWEVFEYAMYNSLNPLTDHKNLGTTERIAI